MTQNTDAENNQLLRFPCEFPIKVMGEKDKDIEAFVLQTLKKHVAKKDILETNNRLSSNEKYISVTAIFMAKSREQLDEIYKELTANKDVVMAL